MTLSSIKDMLIAIRARCGAMDLKLQCGCDGAVNARVAIVAEAPGEREVTMGMPLVGGSGQVLWTALRRYNVKRTDVYITNVIKRQLLSANDSKIVIGADELQHWQELLRWELTQLPNLDTVLILGGPAMHALTGESGITQWRGSVVPFELRHVETFPNQPPQVRKRALTGVITYNPAFVLREPKTEPVFKMDLHKLDRVLKGQFKPHAITYHINPSPTDAVLWMHEMRTGGLPVAFDIETMSGETACVGLANNAHEGMCINFRDQDRNRWTMEKELDVRYWLQQLFMHPDVQFVAQNGMFDCTWLWYKDRIRVKPLWFDTMLAHHTLYSQLPHGLGFLCAQYTNHPFYKDDGKDWREGGDIDVFWRYNVTDVCITRACQLRMENELAQFGQSRFFFEHVMRLQPHLVRMTVSGLRVDAPFKEQLTHELTEQVQRLREQFQIAARLATHNADLTVNPDSPHQLARLFFKDLRLVGRGSSTDAINRKRMYDHPQTGERARAMLDALNAYKRDAKFLSTYAEMKIDPDGRVRCEYKQTGVQSAPGRLSSAAVMWGSGGNLQNWPDRAHRMVIADDGYVFLYFDLSQAEARVVGWLANIDTWIEQFEKARFDGSFDCHRALASDMFGIPYDEVPTADREADGAPTLRYIAKRCRHGLNYRMAADKLAETTGLALPRAREAYNLYHSTSPELRQWWAALEHEVRKDRLLVSPKGRVLRIMERLTEEALESIVAFKPQSTIGDHVCEVIYRAEDDDLWPRHARMCLNVHDALVALVRRDSVMAAAQVMKRHAEAPIMVNGKPLIIPAEFAVSTVEDGYHRWSSLKKVKSLDQLSDMLREVA